ncbi:MAG: ABC transporter ATP-binding protein [Actinomycetaceae bacterium]|nr:ABC transporter ATP-binding protein [Actinomycetaceae bacterium]
MTTDTQSHTATEPVDESAIGESTDMDPAAKRKAGKAALNELLKPVKGMLTLGRALAVVSSVIAIAPYIALTRIGELLLAAYRAGAPVDSAALRSNVTLLVAAFVTQLTVYFVALGVTHFADLRLVTHLRKQILQRVSSAPLAWFSESTSGSIRKAVQDDTKTLHTLIAHAPVETTAAIATPLVLVIYAFTIDWRLGLLSLATYPIYAYLQYMMMADMGEKTAEMDTKLGEVSATGVEFAEGIEVVKGFGRTGKAHSRYAEAAERFAEFYWDWCGPLLKGSSLSMAVISVPILLFVNLGGGALMIAAGWVSVPQVLTCSLIALVVPMVIEVLGMTAWAYQLAGNSALRIVEILTTEQLATSSADQSEDAAIWAHRRYTEPVGASFENVSYAYVSDGTRIEALKNVSLELPPESITALIGASGSGKSTLATMLARFRDPDAGRVLIDGKDIRQMSEAELYRSVAFVLQDAQLMRMSIRDNIALARPDASDEEIRAVADSANILADIEALPKGFDTVVGDDTDLSGGQKQRIAIARALLADTPLLILDEATASTDPDCEAEIQAALNRLVLGRTVLVIAHHAESVIGADQICVLSSGRVDAVGTVAEVSDNAYWQRLLRDSGEEGQNNG